MLSGKCLSIIGILTSYLSLFLVQSKSCQSFLGVPPTPTKMCNKLAFKSPQTLFSKLLFSFLFITVPAVCKCNPVHVYFDDSSVGHIPKKTHIDLQSALLSPKTCSLVLWHTYILFAHLLGVHISYPSNGKNSLL